ncbi:MAG TPA: putative peptidoglycan binding domain-containing protein, partial [Bacteroidota bacterium]
IMSNKAYKGFVFYHGPVNGVFDQATNKALQDFMGWENYDVRIRQDDLIDKEVLEDIRKNYAGWQTSNKK